MQQISAGGVVFDPEGRIALVKQLDRSGNLRWTFPKGRLEPGETPSEAAFREVHEETGIEARIVEPLGVYRGRRRTTHYFRMLLLRDDGVFDDETYELRFVGLPRAKRLLRSRRDRRVLEWAEAASPLPGRPWYARTGVAAPLVSSF
jgi:8-oxo-dGTP pyrophosphatase MutT (NUDIX family)